MRRGVLTFVSAGVFLGGLLLWGPPISMAQEGAKKSAASTLAPAEISWLSYDVGMARAKKEGKHVLIDFYTTWCGYCKKMDRSTFRDKAVVGFISKSMVAVKVNAESNKPIMHEGKRLTERELSRRVYGVRGYPTYWFVSPKGEKLFYIPGYRSGPDFLNFAEYAGGGHYKKGSYKSFLESKKSRKRSSK